MCEFYLQQGVPGLLLLCVWCWCRFILRRKGPLNDSFMFLNGQMSACVFSVSENAAGWCVLLSAVLT